MCSVQQQQQQQQVTGGVLMKQGAEAKIYSGSFYGNAVIIKERFSKTYRHPTLDKTLTLTRTRSEIRSMMRCRAHGIPTPALYLVDLQSYKIYMEFISDSMTVRDFIRKQLKSPQFIDKLKPIAENIGRNIAKMHENNIIHGDLTTSNILLKSNNIDVVFIDFGLSYIENLTEDKGVDLYVLERAFLSTHPNTEEIFDCILNSYISYNPQTANEVIKKLNEVRMRGRKRTMIG
ncbi:EKC/KEOPS complex subunit TP53RK-like [Tubulanus polymorphus]|uniref:EKC/KEOPS complex subunit TP53RK-like n=1 Tax=Tubulanus polymorphus TaxID=672921 RepID=UPI003DA4F7AA